MSIQGIGYEGKKTKDLVKIIPTRSIAVLHHEDIDPIAAQSLVSKKVKAVLNFRTSMTGTFEHDGILLLLEAHIPVFDLQSPLLVDTLDRKKLKIEGNVLFSFIDNSWTAIGKLKEYRFAEIAQLKKMAELHFPKQFAQFVSNSLNYAEKELPDFLRKQKKELSSFSSLKNRNVLIVIRGVHFEKDLTAMWPWLKKENLKIIAVDGAADMLLQYGIQPHFIIGDMDSVSESSLRSGATLIAHSYKNGSSPGFERLKKLQLQGKHLSFIGTSEDVAIIFSYWAGAKKIYLIGSRNSMNEFLEKNRKGMGSSLLVKMLTGHRLVDLKGMHQLVSSRLQLDWKYSYLSAALLLLFLFAENRKLDILLSIIWNSLVLGG